MHGKSMWKFYSIVCGVLLVLWGLAESSAADAQMIKTTLSELVRQSKLIVLGHFHEGAYQSAGEPNDVVRFDVSEVFKGASKLHSPVALCNYHPDSEWPDLSKMKGNYVIFVSPHGACFQLTVGYRSATLVSDGTAKTGGITGQPLQQPLQAFRAQIRATVSQQSSRKGHKVDGVAE